jgi:peptidoglycan hydrolase-like protein with peptidoglycan-binding domain/Flp pilus assembly protein TadD
MSRSVWASTGPDTLAKAVVRGAGRGIRLVHRGRLEHSGLGVPRPTKNLLRIAIALVPLASAPVALATPGRSQHHPSHPTIKIHRAAPARTAARASTHAGASQAGLVTELRRARVVLSVGSGYGTAGGSVLVRALQGRLAAAGYVPGPIDGLYGPRTEGSVRRYQAAHGLAVDGIAGSRTLAEVTAPTPALYLSAGYASGGAAPVRALQRRLASAGYSPGPIDGLFGPRTEHAVRRLQAAHGLKVNGVAAGLTFAVLRGSRSAVTRPRSVPPRARRPHRASPRPSSRRRAASRPTPVPRRSSHPPVTTRPHTGHPASASNLSWELPAGILAAGLLLIAGTWYGRRRRIARPDVSLENPRHAAPAELPDPNGRALAPHEASPMVLEDEARQAIERGEAVKAFNLAVLLEKQADQDGARAAYEQADQAGHAGAACNLGVMMEVEGELSEARAAYQRADQRGDANGAFNLGALLEEQGDPDAARAAYQRADQRGHAEAATNLGVVLEINGDTESARKAYERAEQRGDPHGAANLGALLEEQGDRDAARAAYRRAKRMKRSTPDTVRVTSHRAQPSPQPSPTPTEGGGAA